MTDDHDSDSIESSWEAAVLFIVPDVLVLAEPKIKTPSSRDACPGQWLGLGRPIHRPPHLRPFISYSAMNVAAAMSRPLLLLSVVGLTSAG